jgi:hypothetical protein
LRVLIVHESLYGTNRTIARAVAAGIGADASITKQLRRVGARLVSEPAHFYSADGVGALVAGEEARAREWGAQLADLIPLR